MSSRHLKLAYEIKSQLVFLAQERSLNLFKLRSMGIQPDFNKIQGGKKIPAYSTF